MNWSKKELKKLKKYDYLRNDIAGTPSEFLDEDDVKEMLALEAELLISNKTVIGYVYTKLEGVYSFNEALSKENYYVKQGKIFTYHPVNFSNIEKFVDFLNGKVRA